MRSGLIVSQSRRGVDEDGPEKLRVVTGKQGLEDM